MKQLGQWIVCRWEPKLKSKTKNKSQKSAKKRASRHPSPSGQWFFPPHRRSSPPAEAEQGKHGKNPTLGYPMPSEELYQRRLDLLKKRTAPSPLFGFSKTTRPDVREVETHTTETIYVDTPPILKTQEVFTTTYAEAAVAPATTSNPTPAAQVENAVATTTTQSVSTAVAKPQLEAIAGRIRIRDLIQPEGDLRKSLEDFFLDQRSEHTQRAYAKDYKRFIRFLLVREQARGNEWVDRSILVAYKDFLLSEKLNSTSIDRHLSTLKSLFKWFTEDGLLDKNPAQAVRFLSPRRLSTTQAFSDEEVIRVLAVPNLHTRAGAMHYAALMVLFFCGLRRSEICALQFENLGTERNTRVLRLRGKGDKERIIPITEAIWNALLHYFRMTAKLRYFGQPEFSERYIFTPIKNNVSKVMEKPLDPSAIFYIVRKYARKAGVQNRVSPHSCRATAISNARDHQVPDRAIQEFAGWASPDMITRYDKRKTAIEKSAIFSIQYGKNPDRTETEEPGSIPRSKNPVENENTNLPLDAIETADPESKDVSH